MWMALGPGSELVSFGVGCIAGKYLNLYGYEGLPEPITHVPPGWTRWVGMQVRVEVDMHRNRSKVPSDARAGMIGF